MVKRESTAPFLFFILDLPSGISSGFASITLPFILTQAGFSVAAAGYIVALGVSANLWRFLWGPVADFTLSARRWYLIGLVTTAVTLLLLGLIPLRPDSTGLLNAVVFISQVASTLVMLPLGGLMAHTVSDDMKGRAAGWYQAGNLGGNGIGGGAGVWLAAHYSKEVAAWSISLSMLACALALFFVSDVRLVATETFVQRMRFLGQDLLAIVRSALPLFITVLVCSPIGAGGMSNLWAAVAPDWHADADTVALVGGVLNGDNQRSGMRRWRLGGGSNRNMVGLLRLRSGYCNRRHCHGHRFTNAGHFLERRARLRIFPGISLCHLLRHRSRRHWTWRRFY